METLIIENRRSLWKSTIRASVGLYFTVFCAYFVLTEGAMEKYEVLFFTSFFGFLLGLFLFLTNTLWATSKTMLIINNSTIESKVRRSKFKIDWVQVSNVEIDKYNIIFFTEGGRKQRELDLSNIPYKEIKSICDTIAELCAHKNIAFTSTN